MSWPHFVFKVNLSPAKKFATLTFCFQFYGVTTAISANMVVVKWLEFRFRLWGHKINVKEGELEKSIIGKHMFNKLLIFSVDSSIILHHMASRLELGKLQFCCCYLIPCCLAFEFRLNIYWPNLGISRVFLHSHRPTTFNFSSGLCGSTVHHQYAVGE